MFKRVMAFARPEGMTTDHWMGGLPWPLRQRPAGLQREWPAPRPMPLPAVSANDAPAVRLYDEGPSWSAGEAVHVTVHVRGTLPCALVLHVACDNEGLLSRVTLTLPAGTDGCASFSFVPTADGVSTLTYSCPSGQAAPPAPRRIYRLADPVAHAATHLPDAAHAILARYGACKWEMAHATSDMVEGMPARDGQAVRAVRDSGFGSNGGNTLDMLNWLHRDGALPGGRVPPVLRMVNGKRCADHSTEGTWGLWCKKAAPAPGVAANPKNRVPYQLQDAHFALAAISLPGGRHSGVVFQASKAEEPYTSELRIAHGRAQARWVDANRRQVLLESPAPLPAGRAAVIALTARPGRQALRINAVEVGTAQAHLAPTGLAQMLIGWGFTNYCPNGGFQGHVFSVIAGKGAPTEAELAVLERYLGSTAGLRL